MAQVNVSLDNQSFPELIHRVTETGERIIVEQQGQATAAIIPYDDLQRLQALESILLKTAQQAEFAWLKAAMHNPAFDFLHDNTEDIYTLADGKPFHDPKYAPSVVKDVDTDYITEPVADIYTLTDGKPFHDQG